RLRENVSSAPRTWLSRISHVLPRYHWLACLFLHILSTADLVFRLPRPRDIPKAVVDPFECRLSGRVLPPTYRFILRLKAERMSVVTRKNSHFGLARICSLARCLILDRCRNGLRPRRWER